MIPFDLSIKSGFQVATYPAGATFGERHSRDYEFVWMIEGDAVYTAGGDSHDAPQGSILLCKSGAIDSFVWDTRRRTRHGWFHFDILGDTPAQWNAPHTWRTVRAGLAETHLLPTLFRRLIGSDPTSVASRLLAASLLAAFVLGDDATTGGVESAAYPDAVARAMAFITSRLEDAPAHPLPLTAIANAACVSPEHLCRLFTTHTKHTPAETVRLLRLDRAALLLFRTNFSVGEIASLCGFASPFHFSRRFKEAFGQAPSDLRREVRDGRGTVPLTRLVRIAPH